MEKGFSFLPQSQEEQIDIEAAYAYVFSTVNNERRAQLYNLFPDRYQLDADEGGEG